MYKTTKKNALQHWQKLRPPPAFPLTCYRSVNVDRIHLVCSLMATGKMPVGKRSDQHSERHWIALHYSLAGGVAVEAGSSSAASKQKWFLWFLSAHLRLSVIRSQNHSLSNSLYFSTNPPFPAFQNAPNFSKAFVFNFVLTQSSFAQRHLN